MVANNPSGRLHDLLGRFYAAMEPDSAISIQNGWAVVFGTPEAQVHRVLQQVGQVYALPSEIREAVQRLPDIDPDLYLRHLHEIEHAMTSLSLHQQVADFKARVSDPALYGLEFLSAALSRQAPEPVVDEVALARIHDDVRSLLDDLADIGDELPGDVVDFLHSHLSEVDSAITLIRVRGTEAFREATESALGGAWLHQQTLEKAQHHPLLKRFGAIISAAMLALNFYVLPPQLVDASQFWGDLVGISTPAITAPEDSTEPTQVPVTKQSTDLPPGEAAP